MGLELQDEDESQHKPRFETSSHPRGTAVAPMAGLVVKVLVNDGTKVEEGQPILVLEAMKMEVCTTIFQFHFASLHLSFSLHKRSNFSSLFHIKSML